MPRNGAAGHASLARVNWIRISLDSVLAYADRSRVEGVLSRTDRAEEDGWFAIIRDSVVARIRTKVGQKATLDADPQCIPPEFAELAALHCLSSVLARVGHLHQGAEGGVFTLTTEQRERIRKLEEDLAAVAKGEMSVTTPSNPDTDPDVSGGPGVELAATPPTRVLSRASTSGL